MDLGACYSLLAKQAEITQPQRLATKNRAHGTATKGKDNKESRGCAGACRAFSGEAVAGDSGGACRAFSGGGGEGGGIEGGAVEGESGTKVAGFDEDAGAGAGAGAGTDAGAGDGNDARACEAGKAAGEDAGAGAREDAGAADAADARQRQRMVPLAV